LNDELNGFLKRYSISLGVFNTLIQSVTNESDIQFNQIITGVMQLTKSHPELSQLITSLFANLDAKLAKEDTRLAAARKNIEDWFNDAMDRAGGWYKRHTQVWLAVVGFALALLLNVDTLTIANALWQDPTLRQSVVEQAQNYQLTSAIDRSPLTTPDEAAQSIRDLNAKLAKDLRLPIGWHTEIYVLQPGEFCTIIPNNKSHNIWGIPRGNGCVQIQDALPNTTNGLFLKFLGLIITAVAVTQGAPFWFDTLQKLVNIRLSGKKPGEGEKTGE